jgi:hypothetical protein
MNSREEEEFLERVQRKIFATYTCESIVERRACIDQGGEAVQVVLVAKLGLERTEMLYARDADGNIYHEYEVVDCCPTVDLGQYVEFTDECTYFITGEHPDTGDPDTRRDVPIENTATIRGEWLMKYQSSCHGVIETVLNEVIYPTPGSTYTHFPFLQVGGFHISMKLRLYDAILDTESIITVPLSPTTATLTGCAGTVDPNDLIWNGSNFVQIALARKDIIINYLCDLGYTFGVDYYIEEVYDANTTPRFHFNHLPTPRWIGIRESGKEVVTDALVWDVDGLGDIHETTNISTATLSLPNNLIRTSPCGNVQLERLFTIEREDVADGWRNIIISQSNPIITFENTQRTCPSSIYDFTPPECATETIILYKFQDGGWVTVQEGETRFEGLESGDYRLQYNCNGCVYNYYFTVT